MTTETNVFVYTTRVDEIKLFSSHFSPFWIWLTREDFAIKVLEIVNFNPLYCKPFVT